MTFTGTNVLITGASRGIGAQIAKVLASYGLKVWINYR
ncbi:MAG: SDR family NAD(P)-dependent oxidoreductase, partial [Arcobacteraceae bacterium]